MSCRPESGTLPPWRPRTASEIEARLTQMSKDVARDFHETYERLAPDHGYETRKASAVPWDEVPANNRDLMIAVCREVIHKWGFDL